MIGTKEFNRYYCAELVKLGFLVFSVEYPLIPDCMIYDQFESVSRAVDKVQTLIETYQGDAEKIYAVADSGGACLLTYAAAMQNCEALAEAAGVVPTTLPVRALGLISGMFYTTKLDQIGLFLPRYLYGKGSGEKHLNVMKSRIAQKLSKRCRRVIWRQAKRTCWSITPCNLPKP